MSSKILVVDDSPTVQKVVAITLASENYELFQALNEDELYSKLKSSTFDLVLLDFTISSKGTGYDTIKKIHDISAETPILLLLGQFDQVDEQRLNEAGVQEKLVKPFDSARFIQRCRALTDKKTTVEKKIFVETETENTFRADDSWTLNSPKVDLSSKAPAPPAPKLEIKENPLSTEIESWGIPIPSVIGQKNNNAVEFPPVIESSAVADEKEEIHVEQDDLAYPETGSRSISDDVSVAHLTQATLSSRLISMNELAPEQGDRGFTDDQTEKLDLPVELSNSLEEEVESDSADDFWMADIEADLPKAGTEKSSVVSMSSVDLDQNPIPAQAMKSSILGVSLNKDELIEKVKTQIPSLDQEEVLAKLREALPPIVEQYIKEYCEKAVERVVWEVIPDLAENLIRKELRSIADSVSRDS